MDSCCNVKRQRNILIKGKKEYKCKAIDIKELEDYYTLVLSKCNNFKEDEELGMISFEKERLD